MIAKFKLNGALFNNDPVLRSLKDRVINDGTLTNVRVLCCVKAAQRKLQELGIYSIKLKELEVQVRSYLEDYRK